MALLKTMNKKVLSLLRKRRMFKILTLLFYSEIWVVLYSLFWVRHLFYSLWVNIALYSGFRCHCEYILFYSEIWVKFYSLFCVKPVVYSQWVKIALYSSFMCHCECILFYSEIWVIFTQTLCVTACECIFLLKYLSCFYARIFCSVALCKTYVILWNRFELS
jgi:hypothetical protein